MPVTDNACREGFEKVLDKFSVKQEEKFENYFIFILSLKTKKINSKRLLQNISQ